MKILFMLLLLGCTALIWGQEVEVAGQVSDENGESLLGATVVLLEGDKVLNGTITDAEGKFSLSVRLPKQCTLSVSYVGYADEALRIDSADSRTDLANIKIKMSAVDISICIVDVEVGRYNEQEFMPNLAQPITIEDVRKLPATFFDPARLAQSFAGVANNNDQANGISIRGNSPSHYKWYLEGVEILNPNHTSNAGTFSDRPSQNAGGVNVLSAQLLSKSYLYKSIYPSTFQNALSGIMAMSMRNGDQAERKHFVQAGLIGLEASSEGPIKKGANKGSYLFNYRYSTVGLLSQLGLDFGGEEIDFQDLAFNFSFPVKQGMLKIFGVGGLSNNVFTAPENDQDREEEKDTNNIDFSGDTGIVGVNFDSYVGKKNRLNITSVVSATNALRSSTSIGSPSVLLSDDQDQSTLWSTKASLAKRLRRGSWTNGLYANFQQYKISSQGETAIFVPAMEDHISRVGAFSEVDMSLTKTVNLHAGLNIGVQHTPVNEAEVLVEPRVSLTKRFMQGQRVQLSSGLYSQSRDPRTYQSLNKDLLRIDNISSWQNSVAYVLQQSKFTWRIETYYQALYDMPLDLNTRLPETTLYDGRNYGLEASVRYNDTKTGLMMWLNGTLYHSEFEQDGEWRSTRYDGRYIFNTVLGKEWTKSETKVHGVHLRVNVLGGFRETPIDIIASEEAGITVFDETQLFADRQEDYLRVDLSIYRKVEHSKFTSTISLDIQNLTNRENESFAYYDTFLGEVVRRNQLGLLPILNYRLQF
jgi:hypothetical protein